MDTRRNYWKLKEQKGNHGTRITSKEIVGQKKHKWLFFFSSNHCCCLLGKERTETWMMLLMDHQRTLKFNKTHTRKRKGDETGKKRSCRSLLGEQQLNPSPNVCVLMTLMLLITLIAVTVRLWGCSYFPPGSLLWSSSTDGAGIPEEWQDEVKAHSDKVPTDLGDMG